MAIPPIEDLYMLSPMSYHSGPKALELYGAALYEFKIPGIECNYHQEGCQKWSFPGGRYYGSIPTRWRSSLEGYRRKRQVVSHIPMAEYESVFGLRRPTSEGDLGYPVEPGANVGIVNLYFQTEPTCDIIWPKWGASYFISDRVKILFDNNGIQGIYYHPVGGAQIIGKAPFQKLVKEWRWNHHLFRKHIQANSGYPAQSKFYEIEVQGPFADCGLRWRTMCSYCGYSIHDSSSARSSGPIKDWPSQDMFHIRCLGHPVCTKHLIKLLESAKISYFEPDSVSRVIASFVNSGSHLSTLIMPYRDEQ